MTVPQEAHRVTMDEKGRLVIPATFRVQLDMRAGGEFVVVLVDGLLVLHPVKP